MKNPNYEPPPGRYRHFKGGLYDVIAVGSNEKEERVVIYRSVETGQWWTRRVNNWNMSTPKGVDRFTRSGE